MKKIINFTILLLVSLGLVSFVSAHEGVGKPHGMHIFDWMIGIGIFVLIVVLILLILKKRRGKSK